MHILGISAYYHDSAAALVHDGDIIAAAQEERFTRKKHDPDFPAHAINSCVAMVRKPAYIANLVFIDDNFKPVFIKMCPDFELFKDQSYQ